MCTPGSPLAPMSATWWSACVPDKAGQALEKILAHIDAQVLQSKAVKLPLSRAAPQIDIVDDWL
jgi:hypothetical protein